MEITDTRRENARALAGTNKADFARRIDRAYAQVNAWIGKNPSKNIGHDNARNIEQCYNKPAGWLDVPHNTIGSDSTGKAQSRVPVISSVAAGAWSEIVDNFQPGDADEWQETNKTISEQAFALRVTGNSMTNPNGWPSIPEGAVVIVEPNDHPENGKIVVAKLEETEEATIKKLAIDGPYRYLIPLNPDYKRIELTDSCRIVGVVKQILQDL